MRGYLSSPSSTPATFRRLVGQFHISRQQQHFHYYSNSNGRSSLGYNSLRNYHLNHHQNHGLQQYQHRRQQQHYYRRYSHTSNNLSAAVTMVSRRSRLQQLLLPPNLMMALLARRWNSSSASSIISPLPSLHSNSNNKEATTYPYDITIGSTTVTVHNPPKYPHLVPNYGYRSNDNEGGSSSSIINNILTPTDLGHLEWMMKKEALLKQDMFLIGPPGGYKRRLVGLYAYLFGREVEVLQISRDSTEADIKQIREIRGKSVVYFDQASIRTALNGHILVLDGIEKAERNVLPLLNNLLENREMHLEDGRHLIPHTRYDTLVEEHGVDAVKRWKLERVHPDFRVIALGLPIPAFKGNPLDPPLRSRFQARNVGAGFHRDEVLELLLGDEGTSKGVGDGVRRIVDLAYGINFMNSREFKERLAGGGKEGDLGVKRVGEDVPWFVIDSLFDGVQVFKSISKSGLPSIFTRPASLLPEVFRLMYPFKSTKVDSLISQELGELQPSNYKSLKPNAIIPFDLISKLDPPPIPSQLSTLCFLYDFLKPGGGSSQRAALLYGGQGCGKSTVAEHVGRLLLGGGGRSGRVGVGGSNPAITVIQVYKDMSTRDLFQVRGTNMEGDTIWRESPLVEAAVTGGVCVLDGVENLHESVVGVIGGLIREGEVLLPDGVTLLSRRGEGGNVGNQTMEADSDRMSNRRTLPIHPDFRLIGVADSSDLDLTPELCSVFMVFNVKMGEEEEAAVCGSGDEEVQVLNVLRELRRKGLDEGDKSCLALSRGLSVAQVKRIGRRIERRRGSEFDSSAMLYRDVMNAVCGQFLPMMERDVLRDVLKGCGIQGKGKADRDNKDPGGKVVHVDESSKRFRIGRIEGAIAEEPEEFQAKIPRGGLFFDIDQHVGVLERLADDFLNGQDHLLVIGNQGVGKNKIVDRLLEVLGRGREYIQLHRDTTVQSLTTNQKIEDGIIKVEDSPLVCAARNGLVLVIDEADKAPAHVTAVLKTLAERGEMILGDGRRIVKMDGEGGADIGANNNGRENLIPLHPNFRMIVLANRPGFPFLGNSFYGSMSHLFSVNPVDNPGVESEVQLLQGYGPGVEGDVLGRVAKVFSELRGLSDEGVLAYPYSTREAVHVVKHLEVFKDDLGGALGNVFDFDWWGDDGNWNMVRRIIESELGTGVLASNRTTGNDGEIMLKIVEWGKKKSGGEGGESSRTDFSKYGDPKEGKYDASGGAHVGGNQWAGGSGGMSTAGLGGVGGPFRLSDGNPVFQVSQVTKQTVPPEILQKARELNRKLYEDKLRELRMSPHDSATYNSFLDPIEPQIHSIRNILNSLQAKSEERKWVKHQTSGDLDEGKLVEGLIGDKNVYRGRMDRRPEVGDPMLKPKLLRLLVDCSGSMYRFNGYDGRLDRVLSSVLMIMEAIGGGTDYSKTIKYEIYGHSGDEYDWQVMGRDKDKIGAGGNDHSDKDEKSRLLVLKELFLHSQFCSSGDHTLEATATSIEQLSKVSDQFDQVFLVVLSDANFERYGISVEEFGKVLKRGDAVPGGSSKGVVKAYPIFIGSLGDQATRLKDGLAVGQSFVCLDVQELPKIIQRIFSEGVLSGGGSGSS